MKLIDTHAHLYVNQFEEDLKQVEERAKFDNVEKIVLPNIDLASANSLIELYQSNTDFYAAMMGLHPGNVNENYKNELSELEKLLAQHNFFVAVGEIGLDYYWDTTFIKEQKHVFRTQLNWAKDMKLPVAIHCREAFDDILQILEEEQDGNLRGVLHCFTGNDEQAKRLIGLNFYLGIGGVLTYKNSGLDKVVKNIDLKHLVLETDAPYLSPTPHRGKRNESAYLIYIAEKLAQIKEIAITKVACSTTQNAKALFGI